MSFIDLQTDHIRVFIYIMDLAMTSECVIDFQEYGLGVDDTTKVNPDKIQHLGKQIIDAFRKFGFCYLKYHGVNWHLIENYMKISRSFFDMPVEFKEKYSIKSDYSFGWSKLEGERLNENRPLIGELHEAFNYMAFSEETWPPIDGFEFLTNEVYRDSAKLATRFCNVLSVGLDLPVDFMRNNHRLIGQKGNSSDFRTLLYPALEADRYIPPGQVRLGEHIDYGTVSFIFQDNVGGLEVLSPQGNFIPVEPIPGTVIVLVGSLLQIWTSDYLTGTTHRILIPETEAQRKKARQSIVFFLQPDDDCKVKCLDGANKYEPVHAGKFYDYQIKKIAL